MDHLSLPADLEQFAAEAVASGRYRDPSEVVRAGLTLLRDAETELADFVSSLEQARIEGESGGFLVPAKSRTGYGTRLPRPGKPEAGDPGRPHPARRHRALDRRS